METPLGSSGGPIPNEEMNPPPPSNKNKINNVCNLVQEETRKLFIDKVKDQFLKAASGMDDFGWDFVAEDQGVTITSAAVAGSPIRCAKGEAIIRGTVSDIYKLVCDISNWKKWDQKVSEAKTVKEIDPSNKINYLAYQPVFPVSARDVLFLQSTLETSDGEKMVLWSSVVDDDFPPKYGIIRAKFKSSGFVIREIVDTGTCMVTFVLQFDLKGWIPVQVMNAVTVSQPMVLQQIDLALQKASEEKSQLGQTTQTPQPQTSQIPPSSSPPSSNSKPSITTDEAGRVAESPETKSRLSLSIPKPFFFGGNKNKTQNSPKTSPRSSTTPPSNSPKTSSSPIPTSGGPVTSGSGSPISSPAFPPALARSKSDEERDSSLPDPSKVVPEDI